MSDLCRKPCTPESIVFCTFRAGIISALREAMQTGADPLAYAAVDVLLQLLQHCRHSHLIDDCAHLLVPLDGPELLAAIGNAAIEQGVLSLSA